MGQNHSGEFISGVYSLADGSGGGSCGQIHSGEFISGVVGLVIIAISCLKENGDDPVQISI